MLPGARRPRAREALRSGPHPLPGSLCPAPAALHPEDLMPEHGAEGARPRGARMRTPPSEAGVVPPPPPPAQLAQRLSGSPRRCPGALLAAGCRRPRRLEGAALTVARGRLNPFLGLPGLGREGGEERWPRAPTDTSGAQAARHPGSPLAAARPAPHPQQFTCWSPS